MNMPVTPETFDMVDVGIKIAREFGFPVSIILIIVWLACRMSVALHDTVIVPIVGAHTRYLEATQKTLEAMRSTQEKQGISMERVVVTQHEISETQRSIQQVLVGCTIRAQNSGH